MTDSGPVPSKEENQLMTCVELGVACYDDVLERRVDIAIGLVLKGLISVGKGAELAGMSYIDFVNEFKKRGLKPFVASEDDIDFVESLPEP